LWAIFDSLVERSRFASEVKLVFTSLTLQF
jgi:hypothetical protein